MKVPFVDLKLNTQVQKEIVKRITAVVDSRKYINGRELESFEKNFARYNTAKYCIGVNSGSDALLLSLMALGIQSGDEVITVANTFVSTADAIVRSGATPVFVDIDPDTLTINVDKIENAITKKTKAIIPVHLYGNPADMNTITKIAKKHKLKVIEDAAQAVGSTIDRKKSGQFGDVGCFSFYPSKNLGAMGDAGAIVTNSPVLYKKLKSLRNYGQKKKNTHHYVGVNSRLDEVQAAILNIKLKYINQDTKNRARKAKIYAKLLPSKNIKLIKSLKNTQPNYHLFVIKADRRDALKKFLLQKGIETSIHYPTPIHQQLSYQKVYNKKINLPVTEQATKKILSLPLFNSITDSQLRYVCATVKKFYERS